MISNLKKKKKKCVHFSNCYYHFTYPIISYFLKLKLHLNKDPSNQKINCDLKVSFDDSIIECLAKI